MDFGRVVGFNIRTAVFVIIGNRHEIGHGNSPGVSPKGGFQDIGILNVFL